LSCSHTAVLCWPFGVVKFFSLVTPWVKRRVIDDSGARFQVDGSSQTGNRLSMLAGTAPPNMS
jgi:hypothetical protein